jgi:flagellar basal-body rod protein FlgB
MSVAQGIRGSLDEAMIENMVSTPVIRMLEQTLSFTEQRHGVLLENIANVSTPGYVQKDLSVAGFRAALRQAVEARRGSIQGTYEPQSTPDLAFECGGSRVRARASEAPMSVAFHDRGIRSMEYLMSEMGDNALAHNMTAQLLRGKYETISKAISMRV